MKPATVILAFAALCGLAVLAFGQHIPCPDCPDCVMVALSARGDSVWVASEARLEPGGAWLPDTTLYAVPIAEARAAAWDDCLRGPGVFAGGGCVLLGLDRDRDLDVDLRDFVEGQR